MEQSDIRDLGEKSSTSLRSAQNDTAEKKVALRLPYGTRNGNRTHNYPLGGGYYIHLTMQAYFIFCFEVFDRLLL